MIRLIIGSSLRFRYVVLAIALLLMVVGFFQLRKMPVDMLPEFEYPFVEIQTEALGLSADEVESLVTLNIEEFVSGTPWVDTIESESIPGLSSVILRFKPGTDIMDARQLVQENLSRAYTLPNISKAPVMLQPLSATNRTMMVGLSSKSISPIQLSVLARWTIKPNLLGIPGVANVVIWGQRDRQLQVQVDQEKLKEYGLTQDQIIRTTGDALWVSPLSFLNASAPGTGGWIDTPNQRMGIRHVLPISSPSDLSKMPVHGSDVRLDEVAEVVEGHPLLIGDTLLKNGEGIVLVVEKFPWASTIDVTQNVDKAMKDLQAGLPGLQVDTTIFRLADYLDSSIANHAIALFIAIVLFILVASLFFFDFRAVCICFLSTLLSFIVALWVLYLSGTSFNVMVLTGLWVALAVVIDDVVVDVHNFLQQLRLKRNKGDEESLISLFSGASKLVRSPLVYGTIVCILAVLPAFFIVGMAGSFYRPFAVSYTLALASSLLVAFTFTPALCYLLLGNRSISDKKSSVAEWFENLYVKTLSGLTKVSGVIFAGALVLVVAGFVVWPYLGKSYIPSFKERNLLVEMDASPGTSHPAMRRLIDRARQEIQAIPGVLNTTALIGRAIFSDQIVNINSSQIIVRIDPEAHYDETKAAVQNIVDGYQGVDGEVQTYLDERVSEALGEASSEDILIRIYGPEREVLAEKAAEVAQSLGVIDGLTDIQVEGHIVEPHIEVKVDIAKAREHGIKPGDVRRAAATIFSGIQAGNLFEEQKVFDVVVWSTPESRNSISSIENLLIETGDGGYVPLSDIAEVKVVSSPTMIEHEGISPIIDITANVRGRDVASAMTDVEQQLKKIDFPLEYHPELFSEYVAKIDARNRLLWVGAAAFLVIFLLLQAAFQSWKLAFAVFITLPMALIGSIVAVLITGGNLYLGSLLGFLAVYGLAARQSILQVMEFGQSQQTKESSENPEVNISDAKGRFTPTLITSCIVIVALLPLVVFGNIAGMEIIYPMAIVIVGGILTAMLYSLFVVPAIVALFGLPKYHEPIED